MLTLVEKVLILAELPLFSEVRSEDLAHVAQAARDQDFEAGDSVYLEGDPADGLHVLVSGSVVLERDGRRLEVAPGQAFGTWGLVDDEPRRHAATVTSASHLLSLEREAFLDVLADQVHVARGMLQSLAARVRKAVAVAGDDATEEAERDFG